MLANKLMAFLILTVCATTRVIYLPPSLAQEKMDGTVIKTNLTACSIVPGKVGTCEGTLVLESKKDGQARQTTFQITRDTILKKGDEKVFLFQLQGVPTTMAFLRIRARKWRNL